MRETTGALRQGAQAMLNRLLQFDPDTRGRLAKLSGKIICLELRDTSAATEPVRAPLRLYIAPHADGVELRSDHTERPDVTIAGTVPVFARLLRRGQTPVAGELQLSGDIELGQRFQRLLRGVDIDGEEIVARWLGDVPAHALGNLVRAIREVAERAGVTLARDAGEYLQHEARVLARREQVAAFLTAVDRLRADVDRAEQRIRRLRGTA